MERLASPPPLSTSAAMAGQQLGVGADASTVRQSVCPPPCPYPPPPSATGCESQLNYESLEMPPSAILVATIYSTGTRNYSCSSSALAIGPGMQLS